MLNINKNLPDNFKLYEYAVQPEDIRSTVIKGLSKSQKELPPRLFYDERGSQLFEQITRLDEYYLPGVERDIFEHYGSEIGEDAGNQNIIVEPGSGNSEKITVLLRNLPDTRFYVPIEISRDHLIENNRILAEMFPELQIIGIASDYMNPAIDLAASIPGFKNPLFFFPGSSIGNYEPDLAVRVLHRFTGLMGESGKLLIGIDLKKDPGILEKAYNDSRGITAAFNRNALDHIKRVLDIPSLKPGLFDHHAWYNEKFGRMEMHLIAREEQSFELSDRVFHFKKGETIHTENSYKFTVPEFQDLAAKAGLHLQTAWTDEREYFAVLLMEFRG